MRLAGLGGLPGLEEEEEEEEELPAVRLPRARPAPAPVDLTHCRDSGDEVVVLSDSSAGSGAGPPCGRGKGKGVGKKSKERRPVTPHSDSTVELNYDDHDVMFDAIFPASSVYTNSQHSCTTLSQTKQSSCATSGLSDMGSSSSTTRLAPSSSTTSGLGSSQDSTSSASTGSKNSGNIEDRLKKKSAHMLSKEAKKRKLLEERAAKRAHNEMQKLYKPGECMKHMYVEVHPDLLKLWYMSDVTRECNTVLAHVLPSPDIAEPSLVMWSRHHQQLFNTHKEACRRGLLVMEAKQAAELVLQRALSRHVKDVSNLAGGTLTLAVFGVKDYFKTAGRKKQSSQGQMTGIELEMAFTDLLVSANTDAVVVNTPNELALLIVHLTKAIAEEPHKKAKQASDEQAEFFMRGENKKCVSVDADGRGLSGLWQQMIAVLPQSSLETARTICGKYPAPLALYQECQTSEGVARLAELGVSRAAVPGARERKLGSEFSRRLARLMTSEDGDELLD